ncbi:baseplate J/gp47 family protein [Wukongibacter baidiensis]|uniref:baseplate J/gp47 family protein n=1 Tax=Wukongibacter baidiensis TaxID=1723361 RepID=UPI003D7F5237
MITNKDTIQNRMLSKVTGNYDKTEGSFLYDVMKTVAIELENTNEKMEIVKEKLSIENLENEELQKRVHEKTGIERRSATKASGYVMITGTVGSTIKEGDLVASDTINFIVTETKTIENTGEIEVLVECEEYGIVGNVPAGSIKHFPITISGITSVSNDEDFSNGYAAESDEELLDRYYEHIRTPATSGNKYHYRNWSKEVPGIGEAKVFPLWEGKGSVKVVIIDSNRRAINDSSLIDKVFSHIEENRPIGAKVTVLSGTEKPITIDAEVRLIQGYSIDKVQSAFEEALTKYFKDIAFVENYVSHALIGNILLGIPGVKDHSNLKINNELSNIDLEEEGTPVLDSVSLSLGV